MQYYQSCNLEFDLTTQGPTYPPSEVMDEHGNFIVIGKINRANEGNTISKWGAAIVSATSEVPEFDKQVPYNIIRELTLDNLGNDQQIVLHTLPLPLPCNNYPMVFAPEQTPFPDEIKRKSYPFHQAPIPDLRPEDGRKITAPITLGNWVKAKGECNISIPLDRKTAIFEFSFTGLLPDSLYTVMSLREHDLNAEKMTRPGPLGVPNVFITDIIGTATYRAILPCPFPSTDVLNHNRIINVVVLWMSSQCNYGGAIGLYGLGGDIHAQLKFKTHQFHEFVTLS